MLKKLDWIVVPGGPGLSNTYLEKALAKPFSSASLHYYHAIGSPEYVGESPKEINAMVNQIIQVAEGRALSDYGLITHSFGNYLAMRALEKGSNGIKAIIMISPMPFQFFLWKEALNEISQGVPKSVLKEIKKLTREKGDGSELFRVLFPYYSSIKNATIPKVPFDIESCNIIESQVTEYDDRALISSCEIPVVRLVGNEDPFYKEKNFLSDKTILVSGVGHYPFFEDKAEFLKSINKVDKLLC